MSLSLVPPEEVTDLVAFQPTVPNSPWLPGHLEDRLVTGRVSQCGTEATLCRGSRVRVHQAHTGRLCAELHLGRQERLLAGPFVHFGRAGRAFVGVALQGGGPGGASMLCICHPPSGRVVRAIRLAAPASHLALVSGDRLGRLSGGWLALATEDRQLLLLGLCLDSSVHHSDESRLLGMVEAKGLFSEGEDDAASSSDPAHHHQGAPPVHPCVHLCDVKSLLELEDEMESVDDVEVTCLEWLPQLGYLGIGLSCGTVHIWDVETLTSVFTVMLSSDLPVVALAVQEPENDPRCCCYLWVGQGATSVPEAAALRCCSVATMHSICFQSKEPGQDGRYVYGDFRFSKQMFEYPLEPRVVGSVDSGLQPALESGELASRIVSFRTVPPPLCPQRGERTEDDPSVLLLLSWQLVRGGQVVGSYLSVFDINQWYRARMPPVMWLNAQQLSPYMGLFSLEEAVAKCGDLPLLDVRVPPSSVKKYRPPDPLVEQAHFPSSLAFSCICLTAEGTVHVSFLGMQRQLLHDINVQGWKCLNDATNLCARLFRAGLIDDGIGLPALQPSPAAARGMLLDVALEHRMVGFLVDCLRGYTRMAASFRSTLLAIRGNPAGEPLLPFVLDWTWAKVTETKAFLDELYVPLFNCSGQDVTEVAQHMSIHLEELSILHRLLEHACGMDTDNLGLVETRCDVVGLLAIHLRALLFLLHCKILPDNHSGTGLISYPYATLRDWYLQARRDLGGKLLVDVLVGVALAGKEEAAATPSVEYPPSSIQQATDIYLRRGLEPWAPHALTYYLLLDISSVFVQEHSEVQDDVKHFPDAFSIGANLQALVQGIWSLDHGLYKEGLEQLQRAHSQAAPGLRPVLSALWGPAVRLLLRKGEAPLAVRGLGRLPEASTPEELALQLDVLLANSRVIEALELVRKHSEFSSMDQLLGSLVAVARRNGLKNAQQQLDFLLRAPLSATEEKRLTGFFCELADPTWLCQAALHFLHCGRPHTALPLTTTLREIFHGGRAQQQQRPPYPANVRKKATATLELMQSFMRIMPSAAKQGTTAARGRNVLDLPVHLLGIRSPWGPRRNTTLRLASRSGARRATASAAAASVKLPGFRASVLPRPPDRPMTDEQHSASSSFGGQRRHSLQSRLEADALSILRTPPVQPWQPPAVAESNIAGPASSSTPASILKRHTVGAPCLASTPTPMKEGACPPTPPAVDDILPTPDATVRKLRFAISDASLSETGADLDISTFSAASSELDQSKGNSGEMASFTQSVTDVSSGERSSQFQTASDSDLDSSTELQEESPVLAASPPSGNAGITGSASVVGELDDDDNATTEAAEASFTILKDRLPAGQTRCLPEQLDVSIAGSPCEEPLCEASPVTASLTKDGAADTEEDLDGTPLADEDDDSLDGTPLGDEEDDDLEANCKHKLHAPLDETDGFEGALPIPAEEEEGTTHRVAQTESVILLEEEVSTVTSPAPLCRDPCSSLVQEVPNRSPEKLMSQPVLEFAACEGSDSGGEEAGSVEEVMEIGASEASDSRKSEEEANDNAVVLLSENSSEALPNPSGTESQEGDGSRSPVATNDADREEGCVDTESKVCEDIKTNREGDVERQGSTNMESDADNGESDDVVTEVESPQLVLFSEMPEAAREPSLGFPAGPGNVEGVEVEQPLADGDSAARILQEESLPPAALADLEPSDSSVAEMRLEGTADSVPALDQSAIQDVESDVEAMAAAVVKAESFPTANVLLPRIVITRVESSLLSTEPRKDVEGSGVIAKKLLSPPARPELSPLKEDDLDSTSEKSPKKEEVRPAGDSGEPSSSQSIPASHYNLRERRTCTVKDKELHAEPTSPARWSLLRGGSVPPSHLTPVSPEKAGTCSGGLEASAKEAGSKARKARAASEEPMTTHSSKKQEGCRSPLKKIPKPRASRKSATPSPSRKTPKSRERTQTPSPRRKARTPSPEGTDTPGRSTRASTASRRLATPSPSRKSATPSPRRKKPRSRETTQTPSPGRTARTPSPERVAGTLSPQRTDTPGRTKRAATSRRRLATPSPSRRSATPSPRRKKPRSRETTQTPSPGRKARTPSPEGGAGTQSPARMDKPGRPKRASTARRRLATPSPTRKSATPSPSKQPPASPAKTPTRLSRAAVAITSPAVEEPSMSTESQSAAVSAGHKRVAAGSPPAHVPSVKKGMPSPVKDKTPSPTKKVVKKGTRGQHRTTADTAQAELAVCSSIQDKSPTKKTDGETGTMLSPDAKQKVVTTRARRSARTTPEKNVPTPSKPMGTRSTTAGTSGASLGTIAEVDDVSGEGNEEEAGPSTGARPRSSSEEPTVAVGKRLRSARRRLPSSTALGTIAEVPTVEAEEEAATPARRNQGPSKRKASEEPGAAGEGTEQSAAATPSSAKGQAPLRKKGKKPSDSTVAGTSTAPPSGNVRAKPTTRRRQQQKKGATVTAKESSSSSSSEDEVFET